MMMNKKELEELYYNYEETMQSNIKSNEISKLQRQIIEETDALCSELSIEQQNKLEHILEVEHLRGAEIDKEVFIYGFALATRLFTAGLNLNEDNL